MNSFIYVDGIVLWVCVGIFLLVLTTFVIVGCAYIKAERDNYVLKDKNKKLRLELSVTQEALYKAKFKVPDIDSNCSVKYADESGKEKCVSA